MFRRAMKQEIELTISFSIVNPPKFVFDALESFLTMTKSFSWIRCEYKKSEIRGFQTVKSESVTFGTKEGILEALEKRKYANEEETDVRYLK